MALMSIKELEQALAGNEYGVIFVASYGLSRGEAEELLELRKENERLKRLKPKN